MIYTDGTHLVSDSLQELHKFGSEIGLKRKWFQNRSRYPHYDLTTKRMVNKAVKNGAKLITKRELLGLCMRLWKNC